METKLLHLMDDTLTKEELLYIELARIFLSDVPEQYDYEFIIEASKGFTLEFIERIVVNFLAPSYHEHIDDIFGEEVLHDKEKILENIKKNKKHPILIKLLAPYYRRKIKSRWEPLKKRLIESGIK